MLTTPELVSKKLQELGNLHDAEIITIIINCDKSSVSIMIGDVMAVFEGSSEYKNVSGEINLFDVKILSANIYNKLQGWLIATHLNFIDNIWVLEFTFNDGSKISFGFGSIDFSWNDI